MADTGVDMNHCQFREDDGDNIEASSYDDPITDITKRKVVQYIRFVDDFDGELRVQYQAVTSIGYMWREMSPMVQHTKMF